MNDEADPQDASSIHVKSQDIVVDARVLPVPDELPKDSTTTIHNTDDANLPIWASRAYNNDDANLPTWPSQAQSMVMDRGLGGSMADGILTLDKHCVASMDFKNGAPDLQQYFKNGSNHGGGILLTRSAELYFLDNHLEIRHREGINQWSGKTVKATEGHLLLEAGGCPVQNIAELARKWEELTSAENFDTLTLGFLLKPHEVQNLNNNHGTGIRCKDCFKDCCDCCCYSSSSHSHNSFYRLHYYHYGYGVSGQDSNYCCCCYFGSNAQESSTSDVTAINLCNPCAICDFALGCCKYPCQGCVVSCEPCVFGCGNSLKVGHCPNLFSNCICDLLAPCKSTTSCLSHWAPQCFDCLGKCLFSPYTQWKEMCHICTIRDCTDMGLHSCEGCANILYCPCRLCGNCGPCLDNAGNLNMHGCRCLGEVLSIPCNACVSTIVHVCANSGEFICFLPRFCKLIKNGGAECAKNGICCFFRCLCEVLKMR